MNASQANSGDANRIDLAAAEWLIKRDRGFTAAEQDEFLQWLATDVRHGEWLSRHQQTWRDFDLLAQWRPEHSVEPNSDLLARSAHQRHWRRWVTPVALALAAGVAVVFVRWSPSPSDAAIAITAAEGYERRALADGSTVELNRGTVLDIHFTAAERRVALLRGEAHFTVTKNARRPFVVQARGIDVRAVGTAFNVRLESATVEVLVTEGRVAVTPPVEPAPAAVPSGSPGAPTGGNPASEPSEVVAGQRAIVTFATSAPPHIAEVSAAEIAQSLSWQPQLLDFSSTPLGQVIDEFNRRNRVQLVLGDPELAAVPIVASIRSDNLEGFVRLLTATAGLRAERRDDREIVLRKQR